MALIEFRAWPCKASVCARAHLSHLGLTTHLRRSSLASVVLQLEVRPGCPGQLAGEVGLDDVGRVVRGGPVSPASLEFNLEPSVRRHILPCCSVVPQLVDDTHSPLLAPFLDHTDHVARRKRLAVAGTELDLERTPRDTGHASAQTFDSFLGLGLSQLRRPGLSWGRRFDHPDVDVRVLA